MLFLWYTGESSTLKMLFSQKWMPLTGTYIPYYTVLYYTVLYYTIQYYTILYYTILYCTILYYTIIYYTIIYYAILYYTILYYTILYYTMLYYTILYYPILYYTILYYTILYYTILYHVIIGAYYKTDICDYDHIALICEHLSVINIAYYRLLSSCIQFSFFSSIKIFSIYFIWHVRSEFSLRDMPEGGEKLDQIPRWEEREF